ncbi:MAG: hypothetical protein HeimC2_21150 [Candidatus Heimdallarchaeota archaeon LC_2]|nr:MAG: hypothetical protein HeimC2_21150 [Candidatus Heimdallarchaeota archaeon LC_2]
MRVINWKSIRLIIDNKIKQKLTDRNLTTDDVLEMLNGDILLDHIEKGHGIFHKYILLVEWKSKIFLIALSFEDTNTFYLLTVYNKLSKSYIKKYQTWKDGL